MTFKLFGKRRRFIGWRELKELAGNVASSRVLEDFLFGMIATVLLMTVLLCYAMLAVMFL